MPNSYSALIAQSAEAADLKSAKCGFESHLGHVERRKMFPHKNNTNSEESLNLMVIWEKYLNLLCTHIIVKLAAFLVGK